MTTVGFTTSELRELRDAIATLERTPALEALDQRFEFEIRRREQIENGVHHPRPPSFLDLLNNNFP